MGSDLRYGTLQDLIVKNSLPSTINPNGNLEVDFTPLGGLDLDVQKLLREGDIIHGEVSPGNIWMLAVVPYVDQTELARTYGLTIADYEVPHLLPGLRVDFVNGDGIKNAALSRIKIGESVMLSEGFKYGSLTGMPKFGYAQVLYPPTSVRLERKHTS